MIKNKVLNESALKSTASKDLVKTKQLTLFDLKSKSITLNKENEVILVETKTDVELKKRINEEHSTVNKEALIVIGGELAFRECNPKISNNIFGDLIMVIELYNTYVKLYGQIMDHESLQEDVKVTKIDYDKLIECLNENESSSFSYFVSIIETMLRMIVNNDKSFVVNNFSEKIKINNFSIQDVCRAVLQLDKKIASLEDNLEEARSDGQKLTSIFDLFLYQTDKDRLISDLFKIELNKFNFEQKLELLTVLCLRLLNLEVFLNCFNELTTKISEKKSGIKECKSIIADIESKNVNFKQSQVLTEDKKYQILVKKLNKLMGEKDEMVNFMSKCARIEPIGCDNEQNFYWRFECLPDCIVREIRINEDSSNWYKYSLNNHELNDLIKYLGVNFKSNIKLIADLKQFRKQSSSHQRIDEFLIKPAKEPVEILDIEQKFNIRRSTRIAVKKIVENNSEEDSSDEDIMIENETLFDKYTNLEPLDCLFNILNDFNKRVVDCSDEQNQENLMNWTREYENGIKCLDLNSKFQILKTLFKTTANNLSKKNLNKNFIFSNFYQSIQDLIEKSSTISNFYILIKILDSNVKSWKQVNKKQVQKTKEENIVNSNEVIELPKSRSSRTINKPIIISSSSSSETDEESEKDDSDYSEIETTITTKKRQSKRLSKPAIIEKTSLNLRSRSAKKPVQYIETSDQE